MTTNMRVVTGDEKSYVGEIRGGFIEIDGIRARAQNIESASIQSGEVNDYQMNGYFKLVDGTSLGVHELKTSGFFSELSGRSNLSGEIIIYVDSIGKEIIVPAIQVRHMSAVAHSGSS